MRGKISIPTALLVLSGFFLPQAQRSFAENLCTDGESFCLENFNVYGVPKPQDRLSTSPNLMIGSPSSVLDYYYGYDSGYYPRTVITSYPYRLEYPPGSRQKSMLFFSPREFQRYHYYSPEYYNQGRPLYGNMRFKRR